MKYNNENKAHRLFLAGKLLGMLETAGFTETTMPNTKERVFERVVVVTDKTGETITTPVRVLVYTSIDTRSREIRKVGTDAIRVCGVRTYKDGTEKGCIKRKRVNRVGECEDIVTRTLERMRTAYGEARTAYHNPTYCKDCGAMNFVTKKDRECCSDLCFTKKAGYQPKTKKTYKRWRR